MTGRGTGRHSSHRQTQQSQAGKAVTGRHNSRRQAQQSQVGTAVTGRHSNRRQVQQGTDRHRQTQVGTAVTGRYGKAQADTGKHRYVQQSQSSQADTGRHRIHRQRYRQAGIRAPKFIGNVVSILGLHF